MGGGLIHAGESDDIMTEMQIGVCKNHWKPPVDLSSLRFCAKPEPSTGACELRWSCSSTDAQEAQLGMYWMPCGALTLEPDSKEDKRRRCRPENIIRTKAQCEVAAAQFQRAWAMKLKSGFQK